MSNSIQNQFETIPSDSTPTVDDAGQTALAPLTPLAGAMVASASVPLRQYRGVQTAANFSNPASELAALLTAAGVYDLGWRRSLRCGGKDRVRWLNGMVTNSVKDLEENAGCYAFVLNSQGRIQGDLDIYRFADTLWLATDISQVETLTGFLNHYIIMDDVVLEPQPAWTAIGIGGPHAAEKMTAAGLSAASAPMHVIETSWQNRPVRVVSAYSPLVPRYEVWVEQDHALNMWKALTAAGATPCGATSVEQLRILEGTPAYSIDITNKDLPQETNQMRALHFTKGCYLGQEIVERIRSRGNVHRTLSGFVLGDAGPAVKTSLFADEKPVGEITSIERISLPHIGKHVLALGNIRREVLERKTMVTADATIATPSPLPFDLAGKAILP